MTRALRAVAGAVVALLIFGVSGEVFARAFGIVDRLNGYSRLIFAPGPSPDLPYRLRPGLETTWVGLDIRINAHGMRGPEIAPTPAPGTTRVLVLGDSVVFGQSVTESETVSAVLQTRLESAGPGRFEVLNGGVQGYDTVAEAEMLARVGLPLRPSVVVVGMSLNDYTPAPSYHPVGVLSRTELDRRTPAILERSEFFMLLRWIATWARGGLWQQLVASRAPASSDENPALDTLVQRATLRFYADPDPPLWERMLDGLERLRDTARAADIDLIVAIFPQGHQIGAEPTSEGPQRRLLDACARLEIRCIDLLPAFAAAEGPLFTDTQHPNAAGHAVAAAALAAVLSGR